jgi:hypothetical protein
MNDKELWDRLKREDIIAILDKYYDDLGREPSIRPDYKHYSLAELKKCLHLFNIKLCYEKS